MVTETRAWGRREAPRLEEDTALRHAGGELRVPVRQVEQLAEEDDLVALGAVATEAEVAGEQVAVGAAPFAQKAFATRRALVDGGGGVDGEEEVVLGRRPRSGT
jgi:hypothetical protein